MDKLDMHLVGRVSYFPVSPQSDGGGGGLSGLRADRDEKKSRINSTLPLVYPRLEVSMEIAYH